MPTTRASTKRQDFSATTRPGALKKTPTGIQGFDEITGGGLPAGRTSLIAGSAGCGKTLFSIEFLIRGALHYGESGVFIAFEERPEELAENVRSLGYDLDGLVKQKKLLVDYVRLERSEIDETGEYDLEGLFIRLGYAIDTVGAKRVVIDTIEALFGGLTNHGILRAELRRLFRWLKDRGVTAIITCERGDGTLTRHGIEEYVSDCVILLDHRVTEQISTRRLRVVKYRGSAHGTDEYPFLIDETGIIVLPTSSVGLDHPASTERVSSGVPRLDTMLGGGFFKGSTVMVSGTAGTGKTSLAAHFAAATAASGQRCLYVAFEESPDQLKRNMRSIGIDLDAAQKKGMIRFHAARPTNYGIEMHLATLLKVVNEFQPDAVVLDPISNLINAGTEASANAMMLRLVDVLKSRTITAFFTSLNHGGDGTTTLEETEIGMSSLVDTWLLLRDMESNGERNRGLYVLKSRGTAHSNQIREFLLTGHGIELRDIYVGAEGVLTGSARLAQEAREQEALVERSQEADRRKRQLNRRRSELDAKIAALRAEYADDETELQLGIDQRLAAERRLQVERDTMARSRKADSNGSGATPRRGPRS